MNDNFRSIFFAKERRGADMVDVTVRQDYMRDKRRIQPQHFNIADQLRRTSSGPRINQNQITLKIDQINGRIISLGDIGPSDQINTAYDFLHFHHHILYTQRPDNIVDAFHLIFLQIAPHTVNNFHRRAGIDEIGRADLHGFCPCHHKFQCV